MENKIDLDLLKECVDVDFETGEIYWKNRPREHFKNEQTFVRWNRHQAGRKAGCVVTPKNRRTSYISVHSTIFGHIFAHHIVYCLFHSLPYRPYIDHIDQNGLNNSIHNLVESSPSKNVKNKRKYVTNKTGITGVRFSQDRKAWEVTIPDPTTKKKIYKRFKDFFEACCFRKSLEIKLDYSLNHGS